MYRPYVTPQESYWTTPHTRLTGDEIGWASKTVCHVRQGQTRQKTKEEIPGGYIACLVLLGLALVGVTSGVIYLVTNPPAATSTFECPADWVKDTVVKKCYFYGTTPVNIEAATTDCVTTKKAALLSVKTHAEQQHIVGHHMHKKITTCGEGYWTSGRRPTGSTDKKEFNWGDGTPIKAPAYTNWETGQPSDLKAECLLLKVSDYFLWRDRGCQDMVKRCYICQLF